MAGSAPDEDASWEMRLHVLYSQAFYRKHGFVLDGASKVEHGVHEVRMKRPASRVQPGRNWCAKRELEAEPLAHDVGQRVGQPVGGVLVGRFDHDTDQRLGARGTQEHAAG